MRKLPFETTSSMHNDFQKGGKTEYQSITEYITNLGNQFNIPTPHFDNITKNFIEK
jgi:2-dehydropantoate 2-reductase